MFDVVPEVAVIRDQRDVMIETALRDQKENGATSSRRR
jgi:hypothetical protein